MTSSQHAPAGHPCSQKGVVWWQAWGRGGWRGKEVGDLPACACTMLGYAVSTSTSNVAAVMLQALPEARSHKPSIYIHSKSPKMKAGLSRVALHPQNAPRRVIACCPLLLWPCLWWATSSFCEITLSPRLIQRISSLKKKKKKGGLFRWISLLYFKLTSSSYTFLNRNGDKLGTEKCPC